MRINWFWKPFAGLILSATVASAQPDPRQMSGLPLPSADLADGTVSIRVIRGQLANNVNGQPVQLDVGGRTLTEQTDQSGRALFSGIPGGALVTATTTLDGVALRSQQFSMPSKGGVRMMLVGAVRGNAGGQQENRPAQPVSGVVSLGPPSRFAIELGEEGIEVYSILEIVNTGTAPVVPAQPLVFELPPAAQGASVLEGSTAQAVAAGQRVTVSGPFPPGTTPVQFAFQLPYAGDRLTAGVRLPAALDALSVIVQQTGNVRLSSPQLASLREQSSDAHRFVVADGPGLPAGATVELQLSGLPHHSTVGRNIALAAAAAILGIGAWAAVRARSRRGDDRATMLRRREAIFADLVRLEQRRRGGELDMESHAARRRILMNELEGIYEALEGSSPARREGRQRTAAVV